MSRTSSLRKQHDALLVLVGEADEAIQGMATSLDAERLSRLLHHLDTLLRTHLASEDRVLHPQMLASGNGEAAATASRFYEEMGGILDTYVKFSARWSSGAAIFADRAGFGRDWRALTATLGQRIELENSVLYPLADAMAEDQERRFG